MAKKKNKVIYNSKEYLDMFNEHKNKDDEYQYYQTMYNEIYEYYKDKIKEDNKFINIEKVRLQSKTGKYNMPVKTLNSNLIILGIGFFINSITLAFSVSFYNSQAKFYIIFCFGLLAYFLILYSVNKNYKNNDYFIFDLALQVLEDIEKEMGEKKTEEERKENQKMIEDYFDKVKCLSSNAMEESAVTKENKGKLLKKIFKKFI